MRRKWFVLAKKQKKASKKGEMHKKNKKIVKLYSSKNKENRKQRWSFLFFSGRKNTKNLQNENFLTIFDHWTRTFKRQGSDFGAFLEGYKYDERALGKQYQVAKIASFIFEKIKKTSHILWRIFRFATTRATVIAMILAVVYCSTPQSLGAPESVSVTTRTQWESGEINNLSTTSLNDSLQLAPDGTWTARSWAPAPDTISFGSTSVLVGNYLYIARGYSDDDLYVYNIELNDWEDTINLPQPMHYGSDVAYDGNGNLYFIFGGYSKVFYRYNIENEDWTQLPDLLDTTYTGSSIAFDGTDLFIARAGNTTDFWRFDISENSWYNLAPTPINFYTGSDLVYGENGKLYASRGSNATNFYEYDISSNNWSALTASPAGFNGEKEGVLYNGHVYYLRSRNTTNFYRYDIASNNWDTLPDAPAAINYGSVTYNPEDGLMYVVRANGQHTLWKFDPDAGTVGEWVGPQDVPGTVNNGGDFIWNGVTGAGSYLYAIRGDNSNSFYRYDISNNSWTTMAPTLANMNYDTKGTYHNGYIYIHRGDNTTTSFYRYDVAGNSWSTRAAAPGTVGIGSGSAYLNDGGTDYIFTSRGNAQNALYRYDIDANNWSTMSNITTADGTNYYCYYGCQLKTNGTDLFLIPGDGETAFLKYTVATDTWSELSRTPFSQRLGTDMAYRDGRLYAFAGDYSDATWEYNIATDSWRRLPSNQKYTYGRGPSNGASIVYAGGDSFYASPGTDITDFWSYTLGSADFVLSGTYVSDTIDLSYVDSWVSLTGTQDTPTNTAAIGYETRTSDDGEIWSAWQALSGASIQSPERRYIQVRITLSSTDGASTPTLYDYTISYNSEDIDPSNPDTMTVTSQQIGGEELVSGTAYKHAHPYFSWSGATDDDSGVEGYYVYFGTNSGADPETAGTFQMSSTYSVNLAMETGDYYMRIKTLDADGNVSDNAWDAFTYSYDGVSPYQSITKTSQADFEAGTVDNVSTSNDPDELQLESVDGFWDEVRLSNTPGTMRYGAELAQADGDIYALRGNNQDDLYFYDVSEDAWSSLANTPESVYYGGSLVEGPSGYLYASRGYNTSTFWRYDIAQNLWTVIASAPKNFYYGSSLSYDGSRYIYAIPGNDDAFYRFDTQTNQWTTLPNAEFGNPNEADGQRTYVGSDSAYDGTNALYVMQGNYYNYFSKYTISDNPERGESANEWVTLKPLPIGSYTGGNLSYDPETNAVYALTGNYRQNFFKYDVATDEWTQMPNIPASVEYGSSMTVIDGYIYTLRGYNSTLFYRFNIEEESWDNPTQGFFGPTTETSGTYFDYYYGTEMEEDNAGNIYIVRGDYSDDFGVYDTDTGEFTRLARTPVGIYNGSTMVFNEDEGALYLTSGDLRTRKSGIVNNYFMKYTISTNTWEIITNDPAPYQTSYGSSMVYDGDQFIYLTRGSNSNTWWRYDTSAAEGARWSGTLPTTTGWTQGYGSNMVYKEVGANKYIYSCRGNNYTTCFRYDVDAGTWLQISDTLGGVRYGGALMDGNDGYLYLTRGNNTTDFYRYNIAGNSWETVDNVPAQVYPGGAAVATNNRFWAIAGHGTNTYYDGVYNYLITSEANDIGYEKRGSYTSEAIDLTDVYRWANISVTFTQPNNTNLRIYTRTSADAIDWSSWTETTGEKDFGSNQHLYDIQSATNRYIQVRMDFVSSDQIYSPKVEDYTINYYQDLSAPTNPSAVTAYDTSAMGTTLTTNNWYGHTAPYFVWPAAEDVGGASDGPGGSGVIGYYVYFGTNSGADPYIDGAYQTATTYEASSMTTGQTHYLLIKAVDDAQVIPAGSFNAFSYRYDSSPPTNPTDITVDPIGYTATDSYQFMWNADAADTESGLARFQYQTGGDDPANWIDIDDPSEVSLSLPNADHLDAAYRSGKNTFYLRAVDNAGNISAPISQDYYFSQDAPSPPRNLVVAPETSDTNSFAFTWDQPDSYMGNANGITYHYSVNTLPNAYNTTETLLRAAGPGPFATQRGTNRFYVCAMDEAGNIDYDLYAYADFTADTSAPGAPVNVQIFDTSDRENEEYSIAIKWSPPTLMNEDNFAGYVIYRSDDDSTYEEVATTSGSAYVDTELESRLYYYYVKSKDSTNNISVQSSTVELIPTGKYTTPPTLVTEPSTSIKAFSISVSWGTNRVASSFIEYGKSMSLGKTNGQVDSVTDHTVEVTGLDAGTKYYFRAKYIDPDGNIGVTDIETFETLPPPTISEVIVSDIGLNTATISWETNTNATCTLKYGEGTLGSSIEETSAGTGHVIKLSDLNSSTVHKIQIDAIDADLNEFSSDEYTFKTLEQPIVSDLVLENKENVDLPTITVKYNTSLASTTLIKFKTSTEGSYHNYLTNEYVTEHVAEIEGLEPSVEYEIIASGVDEFGVEATVQSAKLVTRSDSRPPGIISNRAVGRVVGRGKSSNANMYIKIETDEITTSKVFYSSGVVFNNFEQSSNTDPLNTYHLITIPVDPGQVYSYIVKVYDESGNETITRAATVVAEGSKQSATEIITDTFASKFNWMSTLWQ